MEIKTKDFGKDHWSLFAYIETRCVDYKGVLDKTHLRISNPANQSPSIMYPQVWKPEYGTRLFGYFKEDGKEDKARQLPDHDDLDCFDDLETAGLIENQGTGMDPACKLTKLGNEVAGKLRQHKSDGNYFATFKVT